MTPPRVSVLLCVYNGAGYLRAALDSILAQTLADFELIAIDDGSTDATPDILRGCADPRLVAVRQANLGLTRSLNRGLALAQGEYVARQDADDLSAPRRLERQVAFLDARPEVALAGTAVRVVDEQGRLVREHRYPQEDAGLRRALLARINPLPHSSVMFRRSGALDLAGWDERFLKAQDYEFYLRVIEAHQIASLPERLVTLRFRPGSLYSGGEEGEQLKYALLAYALAALRRDHPGQAPPRDQPLPLEQFEAWYRASPYPAHFAAGQLRREAQVAFSRGAWLRAGRALAQATVRDPRHWVRRLLRLPDAAVIELTREFARWVSSEAG
jgi:glycosyltransferase involved in cell wall biosynthesis